VGSLLGRLGRLGRSGRSEFVTVPWGPGKQMPSLYLVPANTPGRRCGCWSLPKDCSGGGEELEEHGLGIGGFLEALGGIGSEPGCGEGGSDGAGGLEVLLVFLGEAEKSGHLS